MSDWEYGQPSKPPPIVLPEGDYVFSSGRDNPDARTDAERLLKDVGCRRFRHELLPDGRMITHGYLRAQKTQDVNSDTPPAAHSNDDGLAATETTR